MSPDDIAVDAIGDLWVAAREAGSVLEFSAAGHLLETARDTGGPEGIAMLPDGRIVIANQVTNTLVTFRRGQARLATFLALVNHTRNLGVDDIYFDRAGTRLLVPDSPNGRLLSVDIKGASTAVIATGLGRPVDVATHAGTVYVAAETQPGLVALTPGRPARPIGSFSSLDEVVYRNGLLYVANLAADSVDAVDITSGAFVPLVTSAPSPQGLAVAKDGKLFVADAKADVVATFAPCR